VTAMELMQDAGTFITTVCAVLAIGWWSFYAFTSRWWSNAGGRLLFMSGLWQAVGMGILAYASITDNSPLIDLGEEHPWAMFGRLLFTLLVATSLAYQWVIYIRVRQEVRNSRDMYEEV
jgi:hypothetical protein